MQDLRTRFGRLVAFHRGRRKLTQQQLADQAGLSVDMIARIEAGRTGVRFPSIQALADALEVDPAELFTTELPGGARERGPLTTVVARLKGMSEADLRWLDNVLDAILKPRRERKHLGD